MEADGGAGFAGGLPQLHLWGQRQYAINYVYVSYVKYDAIRVGIPAVPSLLRVLGNVTARRQ